MEVQTPHQPGVMPTEFPMESFNQSGIKHKTGLLNLAAELGNIPNACHIMGFSRDTFYRYPAARDAGGVEALFEASRRKPNLKNHVEEATEQAVVEFATAFPAYGQVRANNELRKQGTSPLLLESAPSGCVMALLP